MGKCELCGKEGSRLETNHKELGRIMVCQECWSKLYGENHMTCSIGASGSLKKIPKLLEEVLNDEDFKTVIRNDVRKTHLVDYKQTWKFGVITPDIDSVVLRRGDVQFSDILEEARHLGQIPLKKTAVLYQPSFLGTFQNITITGGDVKPLWSYTHITKIKRGESIPIRDIKIMDIPLPEFLKKQGFP